MKSKKEEETDVKWKIFVYMCVCVCVWKRGKEAKTEKQTEIGKETEDCKSNNFFPPVNFFIQIW